MTEPEQKRAAVVAELNARGVAVATQIARDLRLDPAFVATTLRELAAASAAVMVFRGVYACPGFADILGAAITRWRMSAGEMREEVRDAG